MLCGSSLKSGAERDFADIALAVQEEAHFPLAAERIGIAGFPAEGDGIAGAELVDKEQAAQYNGAWMAGSYIRPFTVEFAAKINF